METESVNPNSTDEDSVWTVDPVVVAKCTQLVSETVGDKVASREEPEVEIIGRIENNNSPSSSASKESSVIPTVSGTRNTLLYSPTNALHRPLKKRKVQNLQTSGTGSSLKNGGQIPPIINRFATNRSKSIGQLVEAADGTVVTVKQDVLDMLRKS
ncbi:unnamed protein product [Orchesella dallaii]|uniref:Uncharacterized protein n=1 Tax=Orchesella dallaii TaxID=48710 RepID=A0ABP1S4F3_9HEXA